MLKITARTLFIALLSQETDSCDIFYKFCKIHAFMGQTWQVLMLGTGWWWVKKKIFNTTLKLSAFCCTTFINCRPCERWMSTAPITCSELVRTPRALCEHLTLLLYLIKETWQIFFDLNMFDCMFESLYSNVALICVQPKLLVEKKLLRKLFVIQYWNILLLFYNGY